ncbi:helix-turn-helix transcriptional regulator [Wenxinia marina]|uniref:Putative transcriptional regulator n=1 Tax=Wenxinia marina DSM 24838 TaxID=1123501 RepID=A0A0D0QH21_9RHOB|nr:YafY family protein [Wenxinia marina]KIQ70348.1 putative transcriptional regulator [Wenxinia marina DSM 24838]GGL53842.1 transcriptional regulator [Wenxinia marina]
MSRADRLLTLMQHLRRMRPPVLASRLAEATGVSERTIYRDIATLRASGALIDGEAGYGYTLTEDPALPPQSFDRLELEALLLGLGEVRATGDAELAEAAEQAMSKLIARLPDRQRRQAATTALMVYRHSRPEQPRFDLAPFREACWEERALDIDYRDAGGRATTRRIWPLQIVYLDYTLMLLAWCCLRQDFRMFRLPRVAAVRETDESFRPRRVPLLRDYIAQLSAGRGNSGPAPARSADDATAERS